MKARLDRILKDESTSQSDRDELNRLYEVWNRKKDGDSFQQLDEKVVFLARDAYVGRALHRLAKEDEAVDRDTEAVKQMRGVWRETRNPASWSQLNRKIASIAESRSITSLVTFKTVDANKQEHQGATVKFKLTGSKHIRTARTPARCTERIPIGVYNIWAERKGKPISSPSCDYYILKDPTPVELSIEEP